MSRLVRARILPITAHIDGRRVSRVDVLAWEARRAAKVLKKLGITAPSTDVVKQRQALVTKKLELGHGGIERLLARELRWSDRVGQAATALSRGRRRVCSIELTCNTGSGEVVPEWYEDAMTTNDEAPLIAGCPDHYILRTRADGAQEVVETTGGAPLAMRIFLDQSDLRTLTTSADPAFPVQWVGVGRNSSGVPIGGIRHEFRDEGGGFHARLTVEFPATTPPHMIRAHRWHLACEFSNWIEAANPRSA
jgi:hypothetical protein